MFAANACGASSGATYIEDVFSAFLWMGTGGIVTGPRGIDMTKGGMVITKSRSAAGDHVVQDTTSTQNLRTNTTAARSSSSPYGQAGGFGANGFDVVGDAGVTYETLVFREAPKFFDVVTYTGNGTTQTISHGLGTVPGMLLVKSTSAIGNWGVQHRSLAANQYLLLESTSAAAANAGVWNNTAFTSTSFTVGNAGFNDNGVQYVAYLFGHDTSADGLIQCGSFTTDGSGNFDVNLGWEPQYLIYKAVGSGPWIQVDSMRGFTSGGADNYFQLQASNAEAASAILSPTATGFKNESGAFSAGLQYIYLAIRRGPMRKPTTGTQVYNAVARTGTGAAATVACGFPPDLLIGKSRNLATNYSPFIDRLRGAKSVLDSTATAAEYTNQDTVTSFDQSGVTFGVDGSGWMLNHSSAGAVINHFFRRAVGVFDIVAYTGTDFSTETARPHNLKVAPELQIIKRRDSAATWVVVGANVGNQAAGDALILNQTTAVSAGFLGAMTLPTASAFYTKSVLNTAGATYIAYLWASLPGVSKCGSYVGNGTSQTINCGFAAGARFVMIKLASNVGDWYVFDTTRGIVDAADPYLMINSTAAEASADVIDPAPSGFTINAGLSINGATYVYLALA